MFCTLKSWKCFPGSNRFWWKERWSWCPRASCKYSCLSNVKLRNILFIYRYCVRVPKHNQCNSIQTVMIILGRSWAKGTTRTERIQRWSSKDINNSGIFFLVWETQSLHALLLDCIFHHTSMSELWNMTLSVQGQGGKSGLRGTSGTKGPPVSWIHFLSSITHSPTTCYYLKPMWAMM